MKPKKPSGTTRGATQRIISAAEVANRVMEAIREDQFYVFTHPEMQPLIQSRMEGVAAGRNPRRWRLAQPE